MDIRSLLLNVRKNLPPLRQVCQNEIVLFDAESQETVYGKLLQHKRTSEAANRNDDEEEKAKRKNPSWRQVKQKMIEDLERRRNDEWQRQHLIRIQEEELDQNDEDEEEEAVVSDSSDDEGEKTPEVTPLLFDDDHIEPDDREDGENSDDEIVSFLKKKVQVFDLDQDDDDQDDVDDQKSPSSSKDRDDELDNNHSDEDENEEDEDRQIFISQNFPLTPFLSQSQKKPEMQDEYADSQMLVGLCSGQFETQNLVVQNDDNEEEEEEKSSSAGDSDSAEDSESDDDDDKEDEEVTEKPKRKKIRVADFFENEAELSGDEDAISSDEDDEDEDGGQEFLEELIGNDIDEDDDEIRGQVEKIHHKNMLDEDKRQLMIMKEFFLEDGDLDDGLGAGRKKKFRWNLDNQEDLADFLTGGGLSSDSDSQNDDDDEEDDTDVPKKTVINRLKRTIEQVEPDADDDGAGESNQEEENLVEEAREDEPRPELDSNRQKRMRTLEMHEQLMRMQMMKKRHQSLIQSFLIRDQRLQEVMKCGQASKRRTTAGANGNGRNRSVSIFDVLI